MERFLNWLSSKGQDAKGWKASLWFGVMVVTHAIVLPPLWLFSKKYRVEREDGGLRMTLYGILMLWGMVWGLITYPWRWFDSMYIWPHTKRGKAAAEEVHAQFLAQLQNCKERVETGDPREMKYGRRMVFACWSDFITDFRPYPWHLQRGWNLLKEIFPDVAEEYIKAYPQALETLKVRA